MITEDAALARW